ncbi:MAG: BON domain-containing protein [Acidobacteriota bacterium]|nr:BON domain-containing protein [Acidobacteriota bacterium]
MFRKHFITGSAALTGIFVTGLALHPVYAQTATQPDNTRVNKQDRAPGAVTADQQKENRTDRDLTQQIRKAVIADKSLSTYAHNVKIVSQGGAVVLKGPVRSDEEKKSVMSKAEDIAGSGKVTDQMTVKPAK